MFLRLGVSSGCGVCGVCGGGQGGVSGVCGGGQGGGNETRDPFAMIIERVLSASKCKINFVP